MESQIWYPPASSGWRAHQRNNDLCQHFCLRESRPLALALILDNSFPYHKSLVPIKVLPHCWSSGVVQINLCAGPLRRAAWNPRTLHPSALIPGGFYSQESWGLNVLALEPWALQPSVVLEPLAPQRGLH
ncbi:hypothetical protein HJG60_009930 [Phyllostomus discolor]|uniref:Uncharacterized protein n=1 Tax=Phyllostomus discolor TaxID=89673 RepID=A0A834B754_9CHIR|nr:hypothetical protein HJG60_009930 [Phyllostomus discolor]